MNNNTDLQCGLFDVKMTQLLFLELRFTSLHYCNRSTNTACSNLGHSVIVTSVGRDDMLSEMGFYNNKK
jgi:hypothetical protein